MTGISYRDLDAEMSTTGGRTGPFLGGRRPIFDGNLEVSGYRLVATARSHVHLNHYGPAGDRFVMDGLDLDVPLTFSGKDVFVTASRDFIISGVAPELPPGEAVIELAATSADDDEMIDGCRRLTAAGYRLALDASPLLTDRHPLLDLCTYVKVDASSMPFPELKSAVKFYKSAGAKVIAYTVNTLKELKDLKLLGFDLFEGYLLSSPVVTQTESLTPNRLNCLRLIDMVCDPESSARDFEELVGTDAGLSLRILHVSGIGPTGGLRRPVRSVGEAVVLLGRDQMYSWLALVLMSDANQGPSEQLVIAMTRARMCFLLAVSKGELRPESAFTVGLLSGIGLLLGTELKDLVRKVSITKDLVEALIDHAGTLGAILSDVLHWELGADDLDLRTGTDPESAEAYYVEALGWAASLCAKLQPDYPHSLAS
jgi:EAL and modified HD-GYP domain-containing signal transduction protein